MQNPSRDELALAAKLAGPDFKHKRSFRAPDSTVWKHVFERKAVFRNDNEATPLRGYAKGMYWAVVRRTIEHGPNHVPTHCIDNVITASPIAIDGMRVTRYILAA